MGEIIDYNNWFSLNWFYPSTFKGYHWDNFFFLYLIPIVPFLLFLRWGFYFRFRQKFDISLLKGEVRQWTNVGILRFTPYIFMVLFETMILIALARPQKLGATVEHITHGIDIMLLIDVSESMRLQDLKPNRLEASKVVAKEFIHSRENDKIGIVVFAGKAYSLSPLTSDYSLLNTFIREVKTGMITAEEGTAIGNAIGVGINRLKDSENKTKVMILLSDGDNTAGNLDPVMAAKLAKAYNIKIYSIGIGKDGMVPYQNTTIESSLNETILRSISEEGNGKFYRAPTIHSLKEIFNKIDTLEKSIVKENRFKKIDDYYQIYLLWGIVFFLCWLFMKNTFLSNALED